jgi:hypothetical protein
MSLLRLGGGCYFWCCMCGASRGGYRNPFAAQLGGERHWLTECLLLSGKDRVLLASLHGAWQASRGHGAKKRGQRRTHRPFDPRLIRRVAPQSSPAARGGRHDKRVCPLRR